MQQAKEIFKPWNTYKKYKKLKNKLNITNPTTPDVHLYIIKGKQGTGKTILLNNLLEQQTQTHIGCKSVSFSFWHFLNEATRSINQKKISSFIDSFYEYDFLLFDDFHCLQNKPASSELVYHLIHSLLSKKKIVFVTIDNHLYENATVSHKLQNAIAHKIIEL